MLPDISSGKHTSTLCANGGVLRQVHLGRNRFTAQTQALAPLWQEPAGAAISARLRPGRPHLPAEHGGEGKRAERVDWWSEQRAGVSRNPRIRPVRLTTRCSRQLAVMALLLQTPSSVVLTPSLARGTGAESMAAVSSRSQASSTSAHCVRKSRAAGCCDAAGRYGFLVAPQTVLERGPV
jgi:hypothetical protein